MLKFERADIMCVEQDEDLTLIERQCRTSFNIPLFYFVRVSLFLQLRLAYRGCEWLLGSSWQYRLVRSQTESFIVDWLGQTSLRVFVASALEWLSRIEHEHLHSCATKRSRQRTDNPIANESTSTGGSVDHNNICGWLMCRWSFYSHYGHNSFVTKHQSRLMLRSSSLTPLCLIRTNRCWQLSIVLLHLTVTQTSPGVIGRPVSLYAGANVTTALCRLH